MAIVSWIGGRAAGKVGGEVWANWKGVGTVRGVRDPSKTSPDPTEDQSAVRTQFRMVTDVARGINEAWLKKYFKNVKKMTPYNYFVKQNKDLIGNSSATPDKINFPQSYLGVPINFASTPTLTGNTVSCEVPAATALSMGTPKEYLIAVYMPEIKQTLATVVSATSQTVTVTLPQIPSSGTSLYCYLQAGDGTRVNYSSVATISA